MKRACVILAALLVYGCGTDKGGLQIQPVDKAVGLYCTPKSPRFAPPYADADISAAPDVGAAAQELRAGVQQRDARILSLETDLEACSGGTW
ncbi:MAG: hypothetical protein JSR81_04660 [Proteobacteria bacterium]|nr:hypothetical protein [Pseudomonadota bacterium]